MPAWSLLQVNQFFELHIHFDHFMLPILRPRTSDSDRLCLISGSELLRVMMQHFRTQKSLSLQKTIQCNWKPQTFPFLSSPSLPTYCLAYVDALSLLPLTTCVSTHALFQTSRDEQYNTRPRTHRRTIIEQVRHKSASLKRDLSGYKITAPIVCLHSHKLLGRPHA